MDSENLKKIRDTLEDVKTLNEQRLNNFVMTVDYTFREDRQSENY